MDKELFHYIDGKLAVASLEGVDVYIMAHRWTSFSADEKNALLEKLPRENLSELFLELDTEDQKFLLLNVPASTKKKWVKILEPHDLTDLLQQLPQTEKELILSYLPESQQAEVKALLAYAEDEAGGLMNSRFIRLRPDMTVAGALSYMRAQMHAQESSVYYAYVLDAQQLLLGVVSLKQLVLSPIHLPVSEIMQKNLITLAVDLGEEEVAQMFYQYDYMALPVVDQYQMVGIITADDVKDLSQKMTTEDIQKIGGMSSIVGPYFQLSLVDMLKKRLGWLIILFLGETLTAHAIGAFYQDLEKVMVLALFIPLITSSGGNSGSQISTVIIRALALGEIRLRDWWKIFFKEAKTGLILGLILGLLGFCKVYFVSPDFPQNLPLSLLEVGIIVGLSLSGVVLWGTIIGSMLPLLLHKMKLDPATASTPFVATLVDVLGVMIYFSVAKIFILS